MSKRVLKKTQNDHRDDHDLYCHNPIVKDAEITQKHGWSRNEQS